MVKMFEFFAEFEARGAYNSDGADIKIGYPAYKPSSNPSSK